MPVRAFAFIVSILTCFTNLSFAEEKPESLPDPLTLEYALSLADRYHPVLAIAEADVQQAQANVMQTDASDDLDIRIQAQAQWIEPAELAFDQDSDNHRLSLLVDKTLYEL